MEIKVQQMSGEGDVQATSKHYQRLNKMKQSRALLCSAQDGGWATWYDVFPLCLLVIAA